MHSTGAVTLDQVRHATLEQVADKSAAEEYYQDALERARSARLADEKLRQKLRGRRGSDTGRR